MPDFKVNKTFEEINEKISTGKVVVVTAEEMIGITREHGAIEAARKVDVVTTGTSFCAYTAQLEQVGAHVTNGIFLGKTSYKYVQQ